MSKNGNSTQCGRSARAAIYARVSTSNKHQDPEMQLAELRNYVADRRFQLVKEYVDVGVSGSRESRPALDRLMNDAVRRKVDVVVVWKLDRFGRSLRHLVNALATLESLGISFVSLRDNLDLSTPAGRLMFQIVGAMAEFERELIRERVCSGLRNARTKGKQLGRPRVNADTEQIAERRARGDSWRQISQDLSIPLGTLYRLANARSKNPAASITATR